MFIVVCARSRPKLMTSLTSLSGRIPITFLNNDGRPCDKVGERGGAAPFLLNRLSTFEWYYAINRFQKYPLKVRRSLNIWWTTRRKTGFTNQLKYLITTLNSFYLSCKLNAHCSYKEIIDLPCTLVLKMLDRNKRLNCNLRWMTVFCFFVFLFLKEDSEVIYLFIGREKIK